MIDTNIILIIANFVINNVIYACAFFISVW